MTAHPRFHGWPEHAPSGRVAYVNGRYLPHVQACVHVEDRGLQFADAVYEVFGVTRGLILDEEEHFDRLERSLRELSMALPMTRAALAFIVREMVRRNRVDEGLVYLQITRGTWRRDHAIPKSGLRPNMILTARRLDPSILEARRTNGIRAVTRPDERWARCDIKSTALLPNILAKTSARSAGAFEAWLVDRHGNVTEGSSTTAWIVDAEGHLVTRSLSHAILPGVTRRVIMTAAAEAQIPVVERDFTVAEARAAREAFITAATLGAVPVVTIDGAEIRDGRPGPVTRRIQEVYRHEAIQRAEARQKSG